MRRILICTLAIAFLKIIILPATAQSVFETLAGIKFCRTLKEDSQRLKCFDDLLAEKRTEERPPKELEPKPEVEVTWTIKEDKSPIDDSPQVTGTLDAVDARASFMGGAVLMLRCKERQTEAIFSGRLTYLGREPVKVLVRINEGKPIETKWTPATSGQAVFAPSAVQFIRALPDNGKLFIRAVGYNSAPVDGEFKLGNVSEVTQKIALACNWSGERTKGSGPPNTAPPAKAN